MQVMSKGADVIAAAKEVHDELGPGYTETVYHRALESELSREGISFTSEGSVPIYYKGHPVGRRRPDMFVESDDGTIIVELKAGSSGGDAQLLQYLDLLRENDNYGISKGILIRFNDTVETIEKDV